MLATINGPAIVFFIFGGVAAVAGFAVVGARNVVHAALYLVAVLGSVGAVYLILGAEFLGMTQILIYVGAIVVLLLFGIMLTKAPIGATDLDNEQRPLAAIVALAVFVGLTWLIWHTFGHDRIHAVPTRTAQIGDSIFKNFVLPFEAVSILLLAALIGAIVLARRDQGGDA